MDGEPAGATVLLATEPHMHEFAAVEGSPLAGRVEVRRLDKPAGGDDLAFAERFDALLPELDAIVVSPWTWCIPPLSDERWQRAGRLKAIAGTFSHRFDGWLDPAEAAGRGVSVIDTSRTMSPTVAEFGLAMTLAGLRDIPAAVDLVRSGGWRTEAPWDVPGFVHGDLAGRRVGLAGFGAINRRYAELLAPFGCEVTTFDPYVAADALAEAGVGAAGSLAALAAGSEIFVVGIPPTPSTRGIVGADVLDALPRGALVVVLTRMAVVDQRALWRRAEHGEIRAAVDVFDPEPPPADASFRTSRWVLPTPHIAGATSRCHRNCFTSACADVLAVLAGRAPTHAVTPHDARIYGGSAIASPVSAGGGDAR